MHYFDWTATTKISDKALENYCMVSKSFFGNPSSIHKLGTEANSVLNDCRKRVSNILNTDASTIFFTSGGTESNSIILNSLLRNPNPGEIITTSIEHSAVLEHRNILESHGWKFNVINCPNGFIDPYSLKKALNEKVRLVCIMAVNNVVGSIQPLNDCCRIIREYSASNGRKIHIHSDAVQALAKLPFDLTNLDIDSASFSSHKFYGPKGIGILYNRNVSIQSLSKGGGQEKGLRPGTENLPAISAMVTALEESISKIKENYSTVSLYHDKVANAFKEKGFTILSPMNQNFSPYILTVASKLFPSEVYLRIMNDKGFCLSAGSACSSSIKTKTEGILASMNIPPELRRGAVRISFSPYNTMEEVDYLIKAIKEI